MKDGTFSGRGRIAWATWGCVSAVVGGGCSSRTPAVQGSVTFAGEPVLRGTIVFEPEGGNGTTAGGAISDGRYRVDDTGLLRPGVKVVRIRAMRPTGRMIKAGPPNQDHRLAEEVEQFIPSTCNEESRLRVVIRPGEQVHDFRLVVPND